MAAPAKPIRTSVPGVYRRGDRYVYCYRVAGRQRWGSADSLDEARRRKRQAEADADRGEARELSRLRFGEYALDWIASYQGRTSNGFRESTRRSYRQMLTDRVIPYFDGNRRLRLTEIKPRDVKAFVRWLVEQFCRFHVRGEDITGWCALEVSTNHRLHNQPLGLAIGSGLPLGFSQTRGRIALNERIEPLVG